MADESEFDAPMDDQGINTQYALEIGEGLIHRCWKYLQEKEEIPLDELEKLANITDIAYEVSIKALKIGEILTNDYFDDRDDDPDFDDDDEDGYEL